MPDIAYITLAQASQTSPGRPHISAIWRWCRKGLKSRSGDIVRLQHVRAGGRIYTTADWLLEFFAAVADADTKYFDGEQTRSVGRRKIRPEQKRKSAITNAEVILEEAGI